MKASEYRQRMEAERTARPPSSPADRPSPGDKGSVWAAAVQQLEDRTADAGARLDALHILQAGTFRIADFAPFAAAFTAALRRVATDGEAGRELRRAALDVLVNARDEVARDVLTAGFERPETAAVEPAVALGMLARDDHGSAAGRARRVMASSTQPRVREQAVRVLGADPGARSLLQGTLTDKAEFRQVRRASAVALRALDRDAFQGAARGILDDADDYADIKSTVGGALRRSRGD